MSVQVASRMAKNKIVKNMDGQIIDWFDEKRGGWIVQKGVIVNKEAWESHVQGIKDRKEAAAAVGKQKIDPNLPDRTEKPAEDSTKPEKEKTVKKEEDRITKVESRMDAMDDKMDQILEAVTKK